MKQFPWWCPTPAPSHAHSAARWPSGTPVRWPHKFSVQRLALWVLWTQFDGKRVYTEREVNAIIRQWHTWGDHATLRRELVNHRLLTRRSDCSEYRKLPARPDDEVRWLLRAWRERLREAAPAGRVPDASRTRGPRPPAAAHAGTGSRSAAGGR